MATYPTIGLLSHRTLLTVRSNGSSSLSLLNSESLAVSLLSLYSILAACSSGCLLFTTRRMMPQPCKRRGKGRGRDGICARV